MARSEADSEACTGHQLEPSHELSLVNIPTALLQHILLLCRRGGAAAGSSCRQLWHAWLGLISTPWGAAQYLISVHGHVDAASALFGSDAPIIGFSAGKANGSLQEAQPEGDAALALLHTLYSAGAQPIPAPTLLNLASRAGYVEVVREALGSGPEGLDLRQALRLALEHAGHVDRTRELVQVLEQAGATVATEERRDVLLRNRNGSIAYALLDELGFCSPEGIGKMLELALGARNGPLAHELTDHGAQAEPFGTLTHAVAIGDVLLVPRLIHAGANPRDTSALTAAIRADCPDMLRRLLDAGAWQPTDKALGSALETACSFSSVRCMEVLLRAGVPLGQKAALEVAVNKGAATLVRLLLGSGQYSPADGRMWRAMAIACWRGDVDIVRDLLGGGADPLAGLWCAAQEGNLVLVEVLLATGRCDPAHSVMRNALAAACRWGRKDMIHALLAAGVNPEAGLPAALMGRQRDAVRALLATGRCKPRSVSMQDALAQACRLRDKEAIQELLGAGVDPAAGLAAAVASGDMDGVVMLLGTGRCAPDSVPVEPVLRAACRRGCVESIRLMLAAGVDPMVGLREAVYHDNVAAVRLLLGAGWQHSLYAQEELASALEIARRTRGDPEIVQELLEAGAGPSWWHYEPADGWLPTRGRVQDQELAPSAEHVAAMSGGTQRNQELAGDSSSPWLALQPIRVRWS